jgi:UDP-glucuronate 4-epimerase
MSTVYTVVTGAAGFIGSRLTQELISRGRNVIAIDCFLPDLYDNQIKINRWNSLMSSSTGELVKLEFDLRTDDFRKLSDYAIESIFNQAAMPGLQSDWAKFAPYYDCNLSALNRLLEFCRNLELNSFVQASTSSVYGRLAIGDELQQLNPDSPYGVSKLAAEKLLLAYHRTNGTPVKILRYFSVYGPFQRPDMAYSKIIRSLIENSDFVLHGDGEQKRSNTYIDDIVEATILADQFAPLGSTMNICGDESITLNQAILLLEEFSGKKLRRVKGMRRAGDQQETSGLNSIAKTLLGWNPKIGIKEGLRNQFLAEVDPK